MGSERAGEVFLNASITRWSCLGCCGRALMWEKARDEKVGDPKINSFAAAFDGDIIDASLLLLAEVGLIA